MSFSRDTGLPPAIAVTLLLTSICAFAPGCNSRAEKKPRLLYVSALANLSPDPALDWFGRAVAGLVVARTAGNAGVRTLDSQDPNATHRLEGYFSESGGVLHVRTSVRDLASQKIIDSAGAQGPPSDLFRMSEALARNAAGAAQPYTTASVEAVRRLYLAAGAASVDEVLNHLNAAIAADPSYGSAQVARIQTLVAVNRRDEAMQAIQAASAPAVKLTEEEKLRLIETRASLTGDVAERARATRELARLRSGDVQLWRSAGELSLLIKDFPAAIDAYKNALKIEPDSIALWNTLGYAHAYAGDLGSARKAFDEYRRIAPADANALDSLGEVHYYLGRFAEAEKYFLEAFDKNKTLLGGGEALRAAMSRLMMGDRAAADRHFAKYIEVRKESGDALVPVREGLWKFWTGRRTAAMAALEKVTEPPESAAAARLLLTLWQIQFGDMERARKTAAEAAQYAKTPQTASLALIARWLASPAGLTQNAMQNPSTAASAGDTVRRQLLGYSLLLHRNYPDATQLWTELYNKTSALSANEERVLLAWAQAGRGNLAEVAKLMRAHPMPPAHADPALQSLLFPRSIFLKALAEQHANNREDARRFFKLFLDYSADRDFAYSEETQAREALAKP